MDQTKAEKDIDEKATEKEIQYPLITVRGLAFPLPFFDAHRIEDTIDLKPDPTDIFVVTYPKCGTTWTQYLVWLIINKGIPPPNPNQMMFRDFPFLEMTGVQCLESLPRPRLMKTHLTFDLQPYHPSAKYIYVIRNPWDCCVSYHHFICADSSMPNLTFDQHFKLFLEGQIGWGDFFQHVLSWYIHRNDPNVLILTYEDMKKDTRKSLLTIAKFLGDEYYASLQTDEKIIDNCLKHSDFKYLKSMGIFLPKHKDPRKDADDEKLSEVLHTLDEMAQMGRNNADLERYEEVEFFRKGTVGDWKNSFSKAQIQMFNKHVCEKLKNTEMDNFWKPSSYLADFSP